MPQKSKGKFGLFGSDLYVNSPGWYARARSSETDKHFSFWQTVLHSLGQSGCLSGWSNVGQWPERNQLIKALERVVVPWGFLSGLPSTQKLP